MSSWLHSLSLPNPINSSLDGDDDNPNSSSSSSTAVKEDLSSLFRGVAAFLSPPPPSTTGLAPVSSSSVPDPIAGVRNDLVEIQGTVKSGLSLLSSKLTSNFLQLRDTLNNYRPRDVDHDGDHHDDWDDYVPGITEEILDFVNKLSKRPELWTDFPVDLSPDFEMSDYQMGHAATVEQLVPALASLREELHIQISFGHFWIIYFVLLYPKLNDEDLEFLSTPEIAEVRETLLLKLQDETDTPEPSDNSETVDVSKDCGEVHKPEGNKDAGELKDVSPQAANATQTEIGNNGKPKDIGAHPRSSIRAVDQSESEDDVSFSDLEDDDKDLSHKLSGIRVSVVKDLSTGESSEWVQLNEKSGAESNKRPARPSISGDRHSDGEDSSGWLAVDDKDFNS